MTQIPDEMYQAHTILERYVEIHDKIFKFSWRKAIPIPGLFKPIDYAQHLRELDSLASELKQLVISISSRTEVPDVFHKFIAALLETIQFLRDMCRRLYDKSEGDLRSYTMNQYNSDVATYEELVNKYRLLGSALNEYIRK
ncbi:MAG: hypothetical protein ABH852_03900 [Methanobacteriota archaeon]